MSEEIINRVEKSGLITLDLGDYNPIGARMELDIKSWLWEELILKEKDFRDKINNWDWDQYQGKFVAVYCSTDAIIPDWAFMLIASNLSGIATKYVKGNLDVLNTILFEKELSKINVADYSDNIVLIKGCGSTDIPTSAYMKMVEILQPVVKKLMFGEACSSVPVFKQTKPKQ